jgi:nucleoside-diphosphate-sugar epimerase
LLPGALSRLDLSQCRQIVAFSSTSALTKADSPDQGERIVARRLREAESAVNAFAQQHSLSLTLLRPTMIYDGVRDKNITRIAALIRRFRCFPVFGAGSGLRQPVHADDLAGACIEILRQGRTPMSQYNLSGGETLSYRRMVERIAAHNDLPVIPLPLPAGLIRPMAHCARLLPRLRDLTPAMLDRMNRDLVFDHTDASRDFGFAPRAFLASLTGSAAREHQ